MIKSLMIKCFDLPTYLSLLRNKWTVPYILLCSYCLHIGAPGEERPVIQNAHYPKKSDCIKITVDYVRVSGIICDGKDYENQPPVGSTLY